MEKSWRLISNADGIDDEFATLDEALKAADETLVLWRDQAVMDNEWADEVEGIEIHLVTHAARIISSDGDNEDDGVEYGMTEILGNELDEELRQLRNENARLRGILTEIAESDTPYKDGSPRHVSRGAIILTAQQAVSV